MYEEGGENLVSMREVKRFIEPNEKESKVFLLTSH
jgi:hypothetical protein